MQRINLCQGLKETKLMPSKKQILDTWKKPLSDLFRGKSLIRHIPNKYGSDYIILFNKRRATKLSYSKKRCPFSEFIERDYFVIGNYILTPNIYPFAKRHRLLITKKHYSHPKLKDFKFIIKFCDTVDATVILSLRGSGAGIPSHLHFQVFDDELPVMSARSKLLFYNKDIIIDRVIFPTYAIKITGKNLDKWLFRITKNISYPYNLVIKNNQIIIYPRTNVCPTEISDWRFGATELSGFVITRREEVFRNLSKKQFELYVKKATLPDQDSIKKFENQVKKVIEI